MKENVETKNERFIRVAEARTNKIINMIHLLGNCANTNVYEYSEEDVEKIFSAIQSELDVARKKYDKFSSRKNTFRLK